jgi:hypothetical protein
MEPNPVLWLDRPVWEQNYLFYTQVSNRTQLFSNLSRLRGSDLVFLCTEPDRGLVTPNRPTSSP